MSSSEMPSPFKLANRLPSQSQVTQRQQFTTIGSQLRSNSRSPQQSQPINPWSAHTPPLGQSSSPFLRYSHTLSTTATTAGELFLFGGYVPSSDSASNDLYTISTRDFSATLLKTSGDVPNLRWGHRAALTSTTLLILGGRVTSVTGSHRKKDGYDDSLYLLNLVSREWTRVVANGPKPCGRSYHTMTLVGSKLFVFGGWDHDALRCFNDIWAYDLNSLISDPHWESYEPTSGNRKPLPRASHVSVTTDDHIIIFGGRGDGKHLFNDTWSFNISTRKWNEIQCTGSIPSPRGGHAAVLVDNVMYVFGGRDTDRTRFGDLTALDLSTQRWTTFQDIGSGPCGRSSHAMAADGTRIFLLGGILSADANAENSNLIYVLDTKRITYPDPDPNAVDPREKAAQLARESSAGPSTQEQPQQPAFSLSDWDVQPEHGTSPFRKATPGELDHPASLQIAHERNLGSNDPPSPLPGMNDTRRRVPEEDNDSGGSTEHHAEFVAPDASSEKEVAPLEHERIANVERQLSETLAAQTERDRRIAQLTDQLAQKSALLEQAEANAAETRLELRKLQAKLDESMLSRDEHLRMLEQAQSALQKPTSRAADANERACELIGEYETKLAEVRAELEEKKSELEAVHLQLTDANDGGVKSSAKAEKLGAQNTNTAGPVNTDEDRVMRGIMERMQAMEAEIVSLRWGEKSFERMECSNEG